MVHPGCSVTVVAAAQGIVVLRPEVVVVLGAECAGLGAVLAALWGAATGEEDEHAAGASPATPRPSTMLIARRRAGRRPRILVERCCLAMWTLVPPPVQGETLKTVKNPYALTGSLATTGTNVHYLATGASSATAGSIPSPAIGSTCRMAGFTALRTPPARQLRCCCAPRLVGHPVTSSMRSAAKTSPCPG